MLTGAIIGVVVALGMMLAMKSKAKSGTGLPGEIEQKLRGRGAMNLKEISVARTRSSGAATSRRRSRRCRASGRCARSRRPTARLS
jgi:hypothetical protein